MPDKNGFRIPYPLRDKELECEPNSLTVVGERIIQYFSFCVIFFFKKILLFLIIFFA